MSIFLGKLNKYYKNQKPIDTLTYEYQFEDPEFPQDKMIYSSNEEKNKLFKEIIKKKYNLNINDPLNIEYYAIKDLFDNIFDEKINCTKFHQNSIGNCYFLDVVSLLSNYGQLLTQIFRIDKLNFQGYYEICLFIDGQWQIVIIDDYIPFLNINGEQYFIGCSPSENCNCCYFMLLEKAFAKVKGSYLDMQGGFSGDVFQMLTGFYYIDIKHELRTKEDIFNLIYEKMRESGYLFCCCSKKALVGERHAFPVLNAEKFKYGVEGKTLPMLQLRNPWGFTKIGEKSLKSLMTDENKEKIFRSLKAFLSDVDNGIMWVDDINYKSNFEVTQCCFSMLGSNVYSFRFTNIEKDRDHNIFVNKEGKLFFKLVIKKDVRIILSHFFNYDEPNLKFECCNITNNLKFNLNIEFGLPKGEYLIIATFNNIDTKKDYIYLIINLFCLKEVTFDFICSRPKNKENIIYKNIFFNTTYELLKRTKSSYKHCEDLRDKFLYHQTLIKFFKEKLGCEFTLSGLGFYLETFQNDKVECLIRIDKSKRSKFKKLVLSQKIEPNKKPSNIICVGTSHINGEIVGKGEVWKIKEICNDSNVDKKLDAKCIFRGEVVKNKMNETKKEIIRDEKKSEFKEDIYINNTEKEEIKEYKEKNIAKIEIIEENLEEGIIRIKSNLNVNKNKTQNKIKSPLHNHYLYLCVTERFLSCGYNCNICKKTYKNSIPSYYCTLCDFDMCEECTNLTEFLPQSIKSESSNEGLFWQFKSQRHNYHPLTYLSLRKNSKIIECDNCKDEIIPGDYFYFCSGCEFCLCEDCKKKEKPGNCFQFSPYWHEHPLSFCYPIKNSIINKFTCNHCKNEITLEFSFYCTKCDFHLCKDCCLKYIKNFKDIEIRLEKNEIEPEKNIDKFDFQFKLNKHIHPLTKCIFSYPSKNDKYFKCYICQEKFERLDLFYLCSLCDFKYCRICVDKMLLQEKLKIN